MFESQILKLPIGSRGSKTRHRENRAHSSVFGAQNQETIAPIFRNGRVVFQVYRERKRDQVAIATAVEKGPSVAMHSGLRVQKNARNA